MASEHRKIFREAENEFLEFYNKVCGGGNVQNKLTKENEDNRTISRIFSNQQQFEKRLAKGQCSVNQSLIKRFLLDSRASLRVFMATLL